MKFTIHEPWEGKRQREPDSKKKSQKSKNLKSQVPSTHICVFYYSFFPSIAGRTERRSDTSSQNWDGGGVGRDGGGVGRDLPRTGYLVHVFVYFHMYVRGT